MTNLVKTVQAGTSVARKGSSATWSVFSRDGVNREIVVKKQARHGIVEDVTRRIDYDTFNNDWYMIDYSDIDEVISRCVDLQRKGDLVAVKNDIARYLRAKFTNLGLGSFDDIVEEYLLGAYDIIMEQVYVVARYEVDTWKAEEILNAVKQFEQFKVK